jgi:hypothetical protein
MVKPVCRGGSIYLGDSNYSEVVRALQEKEPYILSANENKDRYLTCDEYVSWHLGYPKDKYIKQFGELVSIAKAAKKKEDNWFSNFRYNLKYDSDRMLEKLGIPKGRGSKGKGVRKVDPLQAEQQKNYCSLRARYGEIARRARTFLRPYEEQKSKGATDYYTKELRNKLLCDFIKPLIALKLQTINYNKQYKLDKHQYRVLVRMISSKIDELDRF